jgi:hypothetical protein
MPFLSSVFFTAPPTGYVLFMWLFYALLMLPLTEVTKAYVRKHGLGCWVARWLLW